MSLFGDSNYRYHETIFVFFKDANRPSAAAVETAIKKLRYKILEQEETDGALASMSVVSDQDFAGMDIARVDDEEVQASLEEIQEQLRTTTMAGEDQDKVSKIGNYDARFDVFHFEKIVGEEAGEMLNPGALLLLLSSLSEICDGIAIDPQSLTVY